MKRSPASASNRAPLGAPLSPQRLQAFLREAAEHRVARRYDEAIKRYEHVEQRNPEALDAPYFLALIALAQGRPVDAQARLDRLIRLLPDSRPVWSAAVYLRTELGEWTAVLEALDQVERLEPGQPQLERAPVLEVLGRIDEAVDHYRRMTAAPAARLAALSGLADLRPGEITAGEKAEMAEAAGSSGTDLEIRIGLYFALGEIEERAGKIDAAFAAFAAGNRLKRQILTGERSKPEPLPLDRPVRMLDPNQAAEQQRIDVAFRKAVFTSEFMAEYAGRGHHIGAPIFIVGMPRSGSTLLEQILSSHRRVQGLGEAPVLSEVVRDQYPLNLFAANPPEHFRAMAEAYFRAMHARGWGSAPRFVDKTLSNYMDIGLIHLMTPKAVILHSVRDPVDTCLACYRRLFRTGLETTYDLGDIGRDYVRYREMMDHWAKLLPGRVIDVDHETLVVDPDRQIRWLVTESCGLSWDEACLRFYETQRPVRTASVAQVRQPIFTTSVERWRRYEKYLEPLFEALGPYSPAR